MLALLASPAALLPSPMPHKLELPLRAGNVAPQLITQALPDLHALEPPMGKLQNTMVDVALLDPTPPRTRAMSLPPPLPPLAPLPSAPSRRVPLETQCSDHLPQPLPTPPLPRGSPTLRTRRHAAKPLSRAERTPAPPSRVKTMPKVKSLPSLDIQPMPPPMATPPPTTAASRLRLEPPLQTTPLLPRVEPAEAESKALRAVHDAERTVSSVYSAGGTKWSSAPKNAIITIWESTPPAPVPWIPERPSTSPNYSPSGDEQHKTEDDMAADPLQGRLAPRKLSPDEDVAKLLAVEARLGATLESLKAQRRDVCANSRELSRPKSQGDVGLMSGRELAAQWLSEDERTVAAREEARRQEVRRPRRSMPWVQPRDARANAAEELRALRSRERTITSEMALIQKRCQEALTHSEAVDSTTLAHMPAAEALRPRTSASLPDLTTERVTTHLGWW